MALYLGLMSGTSADGVEAALADIEANRIRFISGCSHPYPAAIRRAIIDLARSEYGDHDAIDQLGTLDNALGELFAATALDAIDKGTTGGKQPRAIGSHGQTIRHRPNAPSRFSLQIANPNIIAARTGVTTVADFRRRDMALNGQGAPLAPAFHHAAFAARSQTRAIVNLGGIANITALVPGHPVTGFDTGPANTLCDAWARRHGHGAFDKDGALALAGRVHQPLLRALLADPYFSRPPPKSTGPEYFNLQWLDAALDARKNAISIADVQATLVALTARSIANDLCDSIPGLDELYVCGGGVHNPALMHALEKALPDVAIASTSVLGIDPDYVEAVAFAWLAGRTLHHQPGNSPAVTGASEDTILGAIFPA